jgi:DNA-binding MarR family transcriptional regulator
MTHLVDQLVKLNIVERQPDIIDRRVINLALTENGRKLQDEMKQIVEKAVKNKLGGLTNQEQTATANALETLRRIGEKLD